MRDLVDEALSTSDAGSWCGGPEPCCGKCGAPITTGLMAAICPRREQCEFWPDDPESQEFLESLGMRLTNERPAPNAELNGAPPGASV